MGTNTLGESQEGEGGEGPVQRTPKGRVKKGGLGLELASGVLASAGLSLQSGGKGQRERPRLYSSRNIQLCQK